MLALTTAPLLAALLRARPALCLPRLRNAACVRFAIPQAESEEEAGMNETEEMKLAKEALEKNKA